MSTYSLTITKNEVGGDTDFLTNITDTLVLEEVFGEGYTDTSTVEFGFDRNISRSTQVRVNIVNFGDGYEQRSRKGINPKQETFRVTFKAKTNSETKVLSAFLDNKTANNFNIVINGETIKVACEQYSTIYTHNDFHNIQASFRRVYEP